MRIIAAIVLLLTSALSVAETLETETYRIEFGTCEEGEVSCEQIPVTVFNKQQDKVFTLQGSTWHSLCDDGITPCRFQGYRFTAEEADFSIHTSGTLRISTVSGELVIEQGQWTY